MTSFCLSHPAGRCSQTVMETIMKPLSISRRSARWLMAAGLAVALMPSASAFAEDAELAEPELKLDEPAVHPGADDV